MQFSSSPRRSSVTPSSAARYDRAGTRSGNRARVLHGAAVSGAELARPRAPSRPCTPELPQRFPRPDYLAHILLCGRLRDQRREIPLRRADCGCHRLLFRLADRAEILGVGGALHEPARPLHGRRPRARSIVAGARAFGGSRCDRPALPVRSEPPAAAPAARPQLRVQRAIEAITSARVRQHPISRR